MPPYIYGPQFPSLHEKVVSHGEKWGFGEGLQKSPGQLVDVKSQRYLGAAGSHQEATRYNAVVPYLKGSTQHGSQLSALGPPSFLHSHLTDFTQSCSL